MTHDFPTPGGAYPAFIQHLSFLHEYYIPSTSHPSLFDGRNNN